MKGKGDLEKVFAASLYRAFVVFSSVQGRNKNIQTSQKNTRKIMENGPRRSTRRRFGALENTENISGDLSSSGKLRKLPKTENRRVVSRACDVTTSSSKTTATTSTTTLTTTVDRYSAMPSAGDKFVGAHVSAAGGLHNAVDNALDIGCRAFALFLRNQRTWKIKPLEKEEIRLFREKMEESKVRRR